MRTEAAKNRVLTADDGMVLTDGQTFARTVTMPIDADVSVWREIHEAEAQEIIARMEAEQDV